MSIRGEHDPPPAPAAGRRGARAVDPIGTAAIAGNMIAWAIIPVILRQLTSSVDAWTANGIRYPVVAVVFWPYLVASYRAGRLDRRLLSRVIVPASLSLGGQVLWALAPYYLEASAVGFLIKFSIVWAVTGAMVLMPRERALLRLPGFYAGVALASGGFCALAYYRGAFDVELTRDGVVIILSCGVFFGLYGATLGYFLEGVPPLLGFGVVCQLVSAGTIVLMFVAGDWRAIPGFDAETWTLLLVSSALGIALSHVLYLTAIQRLGASIAAAMHLLTPFLTLYLAHVLLGEELGTGTFVAGVLLLAGGAFLLVSQRAVTRRGADSGERPARGSTADRQSRDTP